MNYYKYAPGRIKGMISLKITNITYRTTGDDLREIFGKYGQVGDVYVPKNRFNGENRGFAFVRFYDKRDAEDALDAMDGRVLDGRELRVQMARYGRPASPRFGGGRSSYRRRSYGRSRSYDRYRRSNSRSRSRSRSRKRSYSRSKSRSSRSESKSPVRKYSRSRSP